MKRSKGTLSLKGVVYMTLFSETDFAIKKDDEDHEKVILIVYPSIAAGKFKKCGSQGLCVYSEVEDPTCNRG